MTPSVRDLLFPDGYTAEYVPGAGRRFCVAMVSNLTGTDRAFFVRDMQTPDWPENFVKHKTFATAKARADELEAAHREPAGA